jgi:hypothetical protein
MACFTLRKGVAAPAHPACYSDFAARFVAGPICRNFKRMRLRAAVDWPSGFGSGQQVVRSLGYSEKESIRTESIAAIDYSESIHPHRLPRQQKPAMKSEDQASRSQGTAPLYSGVSITQ